MRIAWVSVERFCHSYLVEFWRCYYFESGPAVFIASLTPQSRRVARQECTLFLCESKILLYGLPRAYCDEQASIIAGSFWQSRHDRGIGFLREDCRTPVTEEMHRLSRTYPATQLRYEGIIGRNRRIHIEPRPA